MKPAGGRRAERENGREGQAGNKAQDGGEAKDSGEAPNGQGQGGKRREDREGEENERKKRRMRETLYLGAPPARSPHHGRHEPYATEKKEQTEHVEARGHEGGRTTGANARTAVGVLLHAL